jgi:penicillin-binding protein 2
MVNPFRLLSLAALCVVSAVAQNASAPVLAANATAPGSATSETETSAKSASDGAIFTRKDARTITLKIPAPRGMIVDRHGEPFAQNEVAYQVALQFRQFDNGSRDYVLNWARARLATLDGLIRNQVTKSDDELYAHYVDRRWLPLLVSGHLTEKEAQAVEGKLTSGLVLAPLYRRLYPEGELAAHVIGYTGSVGKLPTGPINFNEPMWEEPEGRSGLEKLFDKELTGEPGMKKLLFDEKGNKLVEEQVKRPRPGGTLVTTLDLDWQRLAEKTLRNGCRRGAFVVLDAITGEVLVLASRPSFDLNSFIPYITEKDFKALQDDPAGPLYGRAFQSGYPPASSFKPIVALAALNNGVVTEHSTVYCPAAISIGRTVFNNWSKTPEGSINVKRAIARSCNTWFYQVGIDVGPSAFLGLSRRLGFGERTGLPLIGETAGLVPTDEWMLQHEKRRIMDGDTANLSIGQGVLLASPLQVAQAMAGIGNGSALPKLQMVAQIQDTRGRVVKAAVPDRKSWLGVDEKAVEIVQKGMSDVVNAGGGTGQSAGLSYTQLCGKTGTAQWGPKSKNQRLAWFAGFLPRENPRYSFAVLYEGRPGEKVSGGRMAAPMVKKFFEGIKDDIKDTITPPQKAVVVIEETPAAPAEEPLKALPVEEDVLEMDSPREDVLPENEVPPLRNLPELESPRRALPVGDDEVIEGAAEEP